MKISEFKTLMAKKAKSGKNKYGARKATFMGLKFDSEGEASRYGELIILERLGKIHSLKRQVVYELAPAVKLHGEEKTKPAIRFNADFQYVEGGRIVVEDFKSDATITPVFRIKQHLMATVHGIHVKVTKR